jgi:hypothetical protein
MSQSGMPGTPPAPGEPKRRLFGKGEPPGPLDPRIDAMLSASHRMMMERLEEGLEAIEEAAGSLMRDIAAEVWKAGGGSPEEIQSGIVQMLSRDQAVRGLIAHSDERFQTLDMRMARIEQSLANVDRASALLGELMDAGHGAEGSDALGFLALEPRVGSIEQSLAEMRSYLSQLGRYLNERDQALTQWLQHRAGSLASGPEGSPLADTEARLRDAVALHVQALHERLELQARTLGDLLAAQSQATASQIGSHAERVGALAEQIQAVQEATNGRLDRMSTILEHRLTEVTEQVWADALALRRELLEQMSQSGPESSQEIDERLGRMTELVSAALGWAVDQIHDHMQRETLRSVQVGMADVLSALDRRFVDLDRSMMVQTDRAAKVLADKVDSMDRRLEAGLTSLEESFAERAGEALEQALGTAKAEIIEAVKGAIDERVTQLAMMIRSDNRALVDRLEVVEQQAAAKEAIRGVNELAASLPGEINSALDERLALIGELIRRETRSSGDVVIKATGALADRIDRTAERIGDRFDREVETVVDQIGGTMATIATGIQRAPRNRTTTP